eukprot:6179972-Pleurochrysis_carterae.AAC.3
MVTRVRSGVEYGVSRGARFAFSWHRHGIESASGRRVREVVCRDATVACRVGLSKCHAGWGGGTGRGVGARDCVGLAGGSGSNGCDSGGCGSGASGRSAGGGRRSSDPGSPCCLGLGRVEGVAERISWIVILVTAVSFARVP